MTTPSLEPYAAISVLFIIVLVTVVGMITVAHVLGPKRHGPVKDSPYESGVPVIHDTRRRFNVRFYIVAMLFLLFDVEMIFLWPWARLFYDAAVHGSKIPADEVGTLMVGKEFLLGGMVMFLSLLVFGLIYEWKKGAFRWE